MINLQVRTRSYRQPLLDRLRPPDGGACGQAAHETQGTEVGTIAVMATNNLFTRADLDAILDNGLRHELS